MKNNNLYTSIKHACNGLSVFFKSERNGKIQAGISILVVIAAVYFKISRGEWIAVVSCCLLVMAIELMNTAIEKTCNKITPKYDKDIKVIKDISAAAVLLLSVLAVIVGLIIFIPYVSNLRFV